MKVTVFRHNPTGEEKAPSVYELPFSKNEGRTVLSIIRYIHENIDPTLSYFSHCVCDRGICGRCLMDVNGKKQLACAFVPDTDELVINPKNNNHFKDLVCK